MEVLGIWLEYFLRVKNKLTLKPNISFQVLEHFTPVTNYLSLVHTTLGFKQHCTTARLIHRMELKFKYYLSLDWITSSNQVLCWKYKNF